MYPEVFALFAMLTPLAVVGQTFGMTISETSPTSLKLRQGHSVPCGWSETFDVSHPERPPHLIVATRKPNCLAKKGETPVVKAAASLSMIYTTKDAIAGIRVIALEAGSVGDIIRCRSSIDGAILKGRISDMQTVEMLSNERKFAW